MTINDQKLNAGQILAMLALGKSFEKRAERWEKEQGELGKVVAHEIRVVSQAYQETFKPSEK